MGIYWSRLKTICKKIAGIKIDLVLVTYSEINHVIAYVERTGDSAVILINGNMCKEIESVIEAIAHELAHIVLNSDTHNEDHYAMWQTIRKRITKAYNKQGDINVHRNDQH